MAVNKRAAKADINGFLGASGSGKTTAVMNEIKARKFKRLLVWDKKGEFAAEGYGQPIRSMKAVFALLRKAGARGGFQICYIPRGDFKTQQKQFDLLCQVAFAVKNLAFVAEELSDVTSASHAPDGWRQLTTQGRTEGVTIYGLSQSPAQIDKNFFGNCTRVRTGRLNFDNHIKTMANCMSCDGNEIRNLLAGEYIQRDMSNGNITRGKSF